MGRFSLIELRKALTKEIIDNIVSQSKPEVITCRWCEALENECESIIIGFGFLLIGWKIGASFFEAKSVKPNENRNM